MSNTNKTPMTARQITAALIAAKFDMTAVIEVSRGEVEIGVYATDMEGNMQRYCDYDATEDAQNKAAEVLGYKGGYRTGYGSWVLKAQGANVDERLEGTAHPMHY